MTTLCIMAEASCSHRCWYAQGNVCRCSCEGANHGLLKDSGAAPPRAVMTGGKNYQFTIFPAAEEQTSRRQGKPREKMDYKEYAFTASEITQLEYMLSIMPEDREVERTGLEYRLDKARKKLEGVPIPPRPNPVHLAFQGEPVADGVGIDASFAGKATAGFAESTAITTAGVTGQLHDTGAIPHRDLGQQLISGVTHGSFGFEIELPPSTATDEQTGQTFNPAERAVEMVQNLLEASLSGTDEELAELIGQMHPRAVRKVAEFLEILRANRAQAAIGFNGREAALRNPGEVERATSRLAVQNIREETKTIDGTLTGMVPDRRSFEFRAPGTGESTGESIEGRIGQEVHDPYRVAARYADQEVRARIRRIQVGQGLPQYTLLEILGPASSSPSL